VAAVILLVVLGSMVDRVDHIDLLFLGAEFEIHIHRLLKVT
jgi:hypothetical protein